MEDKDITITTGSINDYKHFLRYGFHYFTGFQVFKCLFGKENHTLIAHTSSKQRPIGIVYLQKINTNIWGIWGTFVTPEFRGKGIASKLYGKSFEYITERGGKKAIGGVSSANKRSITNIKKTWNGFLDNAVYSISLSNSSKVADVKLSAPTKEEQGDLWHIFSKNVGAEWVNYLEIDHNSFMERVFGSASCEAYQKNGIRQPFFKTQYLTGKSNGQLKCYCVYAKAAIPFKNISLAEVLMRPHVFGEIQDLELFQNLLKSTGFNSVYCLHGINKDPQFEQAGFRLIDKEFVCYKNL